MQIGHTSHIPVLERLQNSLILDAGELGQLHLPVQEAVYAQVGDTLPVFIYTSASGDPIPTCTLPLVQRDQCASLKVVDITPSGAFLDWGLDKNLLLPYAEQRRPLQIGRHESVLVYLDKSGRLAASSRLDHHLPETAEHYRPWQPVSLLIYQRTSLGLKAVVDNSCIGLLYKDEIFKNVRVGETHQGFVKRLRHDGRVDLALQPPSAQLQPELTEQVLDFLNANEGICMLSDKSSPEQIQSVFHVSKKNFKRALSSLYKQRKIVIESDRIQLAPDSSQQDKA